MLCWGFKKAAYLAANFMVLRVTQWRHLLCVRRYFISEFLIPLEFNIEFPSWIQCKFGPVPITSTIFSGYFVQFFESFKCFEADIKVVINVSVFIFFIYAFETTVIV